MEEKISQPSIGEMRKRRETMADGRRYLIYYTFETDENRVENNVTAAAQNTEETEDV